MIENVYRHEFIRTCPNNGEEISYTLTITTSMTIMVEGIVEVCAGDGQPVFHEELASRLLTHLGGVQVLEAMHHGVQITTRRAPFR